MIGNTPTEPEEFNPELVKAELVRVNTLLPKLEAYVDREFRELPEKLREEVHTVQTIVQPSMGGIEKVEGIIWQLRNSRTLCEKITSGQSAGSFIQTFLPKGSSTTTPVANKPADVVVQETPSSNTAQDLITPIQPIPATTLPTPAPAPAPKNATLTLLADSKGNSGDTPKSNGSTFKIS